MTLEARLTRIEHALREVLWLAGINLALSLCIAVLVFLR
jgi:hypothetical protein